MTFPVPQRYPSQHWYIRFDSSTIIVGVSLKYVLVFCGLRLESGVISCIDDPVTKLGRIDEKRGVVLDAEPAENSVLSKSCRL